MPAAASLAPAGIALQPLPLQHLSLRAARADERAAVGAFVCTQHVAASGYTPEAAAAQVADLADDFPEFLSDDAWALVSAFLACDAAGRIAGAVGVRVPSSSRADAADLSFLFIDPTEARRGLGRALLRTVITHTRARGVVALRLLTLPGTYDAAIRLYESEGFSAYRVDEATPAGHFRLRWMELLL